MQSRKSNTDESARSLLAACSYFLPLPPAPDSKSLNTRLTVTIPLRKVNQ